VFECVAQLEGHENEVKSVAWDKSGVYLATCSRDKSVWIWETEDENEYECVSVLHGHTQDVKMVLWHPTEELVVSVSYDDTVKIWASDDDDWVCTCTLLGHTSTIWGASFNENGDTLVTCSDDRKLMFWKAKAGATGIYEEMTSVEDEHDRTIYSVDWSTVNGLIVTGSGDDAIRVFEKDEDDTFKLCGRLDAAHSSDVNCIKWHPTTPDVLCSAGDDNVAKIWRVVRE